MLCIHCTTLGLSWVVMSWWSITADTKCTWRSEPVLWGINWSLWLFDTAVDLNSWFIADFMALIKRGEALKMVHSEDWPCFRAQWQPGKCGSLILPQTYFPISDLLFCTLYGWFCVTCVIFSPWVYLVLSHPGGPWRHHLRSAWHLIIEKPWLHHCHSLVYEVLGLCCLTMTKRDPEQRKWSKIQNMDPSIFDVHFSVRRFFFFRPSDWLWCFCNVSTL